MYFIPPYSLIPSIDFARRLHPAHLADLRASGLNDQTIRAAGIYSLPPCDISLFFNLRRGVPTEIKSALCFPYQGGTFARIKLFPSLNKMKYAQPPGTGARFYMPFPVNGGPVYVCEGEKKTLAAHQAGLNAVGIGGVWNWLDSGQPIDGLNLISWNGCEATIIPDSDVFKRPDLMHAIYALGRELQTRGASVYIVKIPQNGPAKIGLDDFLVAGGCVNSLEVFSLGNRVFKPCEFWHGQWKFKKAVRQAA